MNQKQGLKIIITAIISCILTNSLMMFLDNYILVHLGDWTIATVKKLLMHEWNTIDKNLIRWFPLLIGIIMFVQKNSNPKKYINTFMWCIASLLIWLTVGVIIALYTWNRGTGYASFVPEHIKYQPSPYYWTLFILIGILMPILLQLKQRKKMVKSSELIDN